MYAYSKRSQQPSLQAIVRRHPERTHALFSNDADLLLLGLACGAASVALLREVVPPRHHIS